jgi:hypothetical protein
MSHDVDLQMADRSSSLALIIPSLFINTIVNAVPEKGRFRCGFLETPDIVIILRDRLRLGVKELAGVWKHRY